MVRKGGAQTTDHPLHPHGKGQRVRADAGSSKRPKRQGRPRDFEGTPSPAPQTEGLDRCTGVSVHSRGRRDGPQHDLTTRGGTIILVMYTRQMSDDYGGEGVNGPYSIAHRTITIVHVLRSKSSMGHYAILQYTQSSQIYTVL